MVHASPHSLADASWPRPSASNRLRLTSSNLLMVFPPDLPSPCNSTLPITREYHREYPFSSTKTAHRLTFAVYDPPVTAELTVIHLAALIDAGAREPLPDIVLLVGKDVHCLRIAYPLGLFYKDNDRCGLSPVSFASRHSAMVSISRVMTSVM